MRVISGNAKGIKLYTRGRDVRPTLARVKKSLFSILSDRIVDSVFLDLFSGTGNIGIEALSRGAKEAHFVERGIAQVKNIMENVKRARFEERACVHRMSVASALKTFFKDETRFDIIFFAPPFKKFLGASTLELLDTFPVYAQDAVIVGEHHLKELLQDKYIHFSLWRRERYGDHGLCFFKTWSL